MDTSTKLDKVSQVDKNVIMSGRTNDLSEKTFARMTYFVENVNLLLNLFCLLLLKSKMGEVLSDLR